MQVASSARAVVNFVEGTKEPVFSNWDPARVRMDIVPVEAGIENIRELPVAPTLDNEGFALVRHPVAGDWKDQFWIDSVYVPSCIELVCNLTGARDATQIFFPLTRSSEPVGEGVAYAGSFLHLDIPREEYFGFARIEADKAGFDLQPGKAAVFNVWKAITPPPQQMPLAICNRHDLTEPDYVVGLNDEDEYPSHFVAVRTPDRRLRLSYVPDIAIDESLVFIAADFDPAHTLGCAHQAIEPAGAGALNPRTSIEVRILALF
ncbi:MAG TPA: CmcJ/NvfI family oxidoreductase [Novosphingobium sp.]|nr:CmcJ/NvfI family oxidoreductase [Novosphingobium sp.]